MNIYTKAGGMKRISKILTVVGGCALVASLIMMQSGRVRAQSQNNYLYEQPTMETLSQLYWALGKFSLDDDEAVDNFMLINDCDIYADYISNEFEWRKVRETTREYLENSLDMFPVRIEIEQPIFFSEYDFEREVFEVWDPYKIDNIKLFEVLTPEFNRDICGVNWQREIKNYPRGIIVEIAEPLSLINIEMSPEAAREFVEFKREEGGALNKKKIHNEHALYSSRNAYWVMKVKGFSMNGEEKSDHHKKRFARVLAALEAIEIYADQDRRFLLYSKNYRNRGGGDNALDILRARVERRLKLKREEEARKAAEEAEQKAAEEAAAEAGGA